jgi:Domain of unknown function (DUF4190)/Septum formation
MTESTGGNGGAQPPPNWPVPDPTPPGPPVPGSWPAAPPSYGTLQEPAWQPTWPAPGPPTSPPPGWGPAWLGQPRTTNTWSIVALVSGIFAIVPLAVGAGIAALVQIYRRRQAGAGMAIAGLVLSALWTLVGIAVAVTFLLGEEVPEAFGGRVADAGSASVGSCLLGPDEQDSLATEIDCVEVHDAEVYLMTELGTGTWPGYDDVFDTAEDTCYDAFEGYVGRDYEFSDYDFGYYLPDHAEWVAGEHRLICVVVPLTEETSRGSARDSGL